MEVVVAHGIGLTLCEQQAVADDLHTSIQSLLYI